MSVLDQAQALAQAGKPQEAARLVEAAAAAGDGEALLAVANWRLFGIGAPRDVAAAHALFAKAGAAGVAEAVRSRAYLVAGGLGAAADPDAALAMLCAVADQDPIAARQVDFLGQNPPRDPAALPIETLSDNPPIRMVRGLLRPAECAWLIAAAAPRLRPSFVVDSATGQRVPNPVRTSAGMNFGPTDADLVVQALNRRFADATGTDAASGEPLHVLRYAPGEEYRPHVDLVPGAANQRQWTVLVYLNDEYDGGETRFDALGITAKGGVGDALIFRSLTEAGEGDMRTRHAGLPVTTGVKWLASRWIRQHPYAPWDR